MDHPFRHFTPMTRHPQSVRRCGFAQLFADIERQFEYPGLYKASACCLFTAHGMVVRMCVNASEPFLCVGNAGGHKVILNLSDVKCDAQVLADWIRNTGQVLAMWPIGDMQGVG